MVKKLILVAVLTVFLAPAAWSTEDMTGKLAIGFFNSDAPVGVRYWVSEMVAVDIGVGFSSIEVADTAGEATNTASFWIEAGFPIKLLEGGERAHFFFRPGILLGILDDRHFGTGMLDEKWTTIDFTLALGAEVFFGSHLSIEATHGIIINYTSPPEDVSDEATIDYGTFGNGLTEVGFRFYF